MTAEINSISTGQHAPLDSTGAAGIAPVAGIDSLLERMKEAGDFPAVSQFITEINEKASIRNLTSATQLANVIIKDYSLTTKLLKMVNSALYGQFAGQIATISRAVVILGFEQVRMAATGLLFFEHMQNRAHAAEIKKAMLGSLLSAIMARDLALKLGMSDSEEIFICSLLHNLGRLLLMYCFQQEYDQVKAMMVQKGLNEDAAIRAVFNVEANEIGMAVAEHWGLPTRIVASLRRLTAAELNSDAGSPDSFRALACFCNELYGAAAAGVPLAEKKRLLRSLLSKYKTVIPYSSEKIEELVSATNDQAKNYSFVLGIDKYQRELLPSLSFSEPAKPFRDGPAMGGVDRAPSPARTLNLERYQIQAQMGVPASSIINEEQMGIILTGIQEVTHALLDPSYSLDDVINMVCEVIYRGLGFSRVLICIKDPRNNTMNGRYGLGQYIDEVIRKFRFSISDSGDIFNTALSARKDLFIDNTSNPLLAGSIPAWYCGILKAASFVLYPLAIGGNSIGLLYADMKGGAAEIGNEKFSYLKMLRDHVVLAITRKAAG